MCLKRTFFKTHVKKMFDRFYSIVIERLTFMSILSFNFLLDKGRGTGNLKFAKNLKICVFAFYSLLIYFLIKVLKVLKGGIYGLL